MGQGELGLRGDWGPLKFTPQHTQQANKQIDNIHKNYISQKSYGPFTYIAIQITSSEIS